MENPAYLGCLHKPRGSSFHFHRPYPQRQIASGDNRSDAYPNDSAHSSHRRMTGRATPMADWHPNNQSRYSTPMEADRFPDIPPPSTFAIGFANRIRTDN